MNPWIVKIKQCGKEYQAEKTKQAAKGKQSMAPKTKSKSKPKPKPKPISSLPWRMGIATMAAKKTPFYVKK